MSRTEKYLEPNRVDAASSIAGNGYRLNLVTAFRARKSTQNLYLGLPSRFFLGTNMAGAKQGQSLSLITPCSIFSTWVFISSLSAGVLYGGCLMGGVSPTGIS